MVASEDAMQGIEWRVEDATQGIEWQVKMLCKALNDERRRYARH